MRPALQHDRRAALSREPEPPPAERVRRRPHLTAPVRRDARPAVDDLAADRAVRAPKLQPARAAPVPYRVGGDLVDRHHEPVQRLVGQAGAGAGALEVVPHLDQAVVIKLPGEQFGHAPLSAGPSGRAATTQVSSSGFARRSSDRSAASGCGSPVAEIRLRVAITGASPSWRLRSRYSTSPSV